MVDGQENPVTVILDNKFAEVQKNLVLTRHIYNPQSVLMSKKTWDSMSAAEKKIIQDAAAEATAYQRKINRESNDKALDALKKAGMQVTELSAGGDPEDPRQAEARRRQVREAGG